MIPYTPTANASVANNSPAGAPPRPGFTPFTPGQTPQTTPPTTVSAPIPTVGSAGQTILPGSTLVSNIKAIPGALLGAGKALFNTVTGSEQAAGQDITAALPGSVTGVNAVNAANQQNDVTDIQFIQKMNALRQSGTPLTAPQQQLYTSILSHHAQTTAADLTPALNKSNEQVAGDFAGVGADILSAGTLPGAASAVAAPADGALQGFIRGAKAGAIAAAPVGAVYGAASGLQQNQSATGVAGSTLFGALTGALAGGTVGGTIGAIKANPKVVSNYDTAIQDVTPNYDQLTPTQKAKLVNQTQEGGLVTGRKIVPGVGQEDPAAALASMDNYNPSDTALQKYQAVDQTIANEADTLRTSLRESNVIVPKKQIVSLVSDAVNSTAEDSLTLQNTDPIVAKYVKAVQTAANQAPGTLEGVLDTRQALDNLYRTTRGGMAFNDTRISALDEIHTAARDALNGYLINNAPNADAQLSLKYQSALYRAQDALRSKAVKEAGSVVSRAYQTIKKHPFASGILGTTGLEVTLHKLGLI